MGSCGGSNKKTQEKKLLGPSTDTNPQIQTKPEFVMIGGIKQQINQPKTEQNQGQNVPNVVVDFQQAKPNPNSNEGDDEFYLQDIMKQFDELNNLFQQMSEEFENMSKYLASINDE